MERNLDLQQYDWLRGTFGVMVEFTERVAGRDLWSDVLMYSRAIG